MPRSFSCCKVTLVFHKDGEENQYRDLFWCGMNGDSEEWWDINLSFGTGLYFYHFTYETPFGKGNIFLHSAGCGEIAPEGKEWQLTVYDKNYHTPDWIKGGIMYQIFPDRFYKGTGNIKNVPDDRIIHESITDIPVWKPNEQGKILNNDYYGGNLKGIEEKLPYIASLGVNVIYLNPIFEAHSNHRYNTADYSKIDPLLGDEMDFRELCKKADEYGIKIILDGVFSHTGSDSIYFNREQRYNSIGAYNSEASPYKDWFTFEENGKYKSWWGIDTLPETNEDNESYIRYIAGKNGIAKKWLDAGAYGYRLDVADELPDKFLDEFCKSVKSLNEEYVVIGEVWEDATNKFSHGGRRKYLLGEQLDSVMNYPFASAILTFMRYGVAESFMESIVTICENYPKTALDCLMNHIGTHDTCRVLNRLATMGCYESSHLERYKGGLSDEQKEWGKTLLKLVASMQFTLPGVPCIYYGDEAGTDGGEDPFNRGCYPWGREDEELIEHYRFLGRLRKEHKVFADGEFVPVSAALGCVAYARKNAEESVLTVANRNCHPIVYILPEEGYTSLTGETVNGKELYLERETVAILVKKL